MLALPSKGFYRSINSHNVDLSMCCDWLEASTIFADEPISGSDVVDLLRENEIYASQDFAWELVNDVFAIVRERSRLMGCGYPVAIRHGQRLVAEGDWRQYAPYCFCLTLSLPNVYPKWAQAFGSDFTMQGELFERLTAESISASLNGWDVHLTGWTRSTPSQLSAVVNDVASKLGEAVGNIKRWSKHAAKEAGLDILCFRSFPDGRVGVPAFLFQCASGGDWKKKLKTPDLRLWKKVIDFASDPKKAFSMPYALDESDFTYHTNIVDGLFLDRHRLLAPGQASRDWVSGDLATALVDWIEPRTASLPRAAPSLVGSE